MSKNAYTPAMDCTNQQRPNVLMKVIGSRKVHAVGYCPERQILAACFDANGPVYHYEGFTQAQYDALMSAESKGKYFGEHIQTLPSKKYAPEPASVLAA